MAPSLRITRFGLYHWRNFGRVEVELGPRAILVGPNASGKSNFLDSIRFLHDVVAVGGGFQAAVARRGGVSALRALAARRYPDIALEVALGDDDNLTRWRYKLSFGQDLQKRPVIRTETVNCDGVQLIDRPDDLDARDPARLSQTFLEQVYVNQDFREVADFLNSTKYLHIIPQLVREPDRSVGRMNDPYGGDFLEQIAATPKRAQESRLRRIAKALKVAVPQLADLELTRDVKGTPHLRGRYDHWRPNAGWQSEDQFSDGTLRLLGLLWATLDGTGPLLLEEPELSLHPEVIRYIPSMLARAQRQSGRQMLLTTQSPDLLRDPGIGVDEVFLLTPSAEGTNIRAAASIREVRALLDGGLSLGDIVMPKTRPAHTEQLALFGS